MDSFGACTRPILSGVGLTCAAGCDLTESDWPDSARFNVQASQEVQIITSTNFIVSGTTTTLVDSDTLVGVSYEATVELPRPPLFLVRVVALASGTEVTLEVEVGGQPWFDATRTLASAEWLEFAYDDSGPVF